MSPPDGPNRPTTEKPALTSALIVVIMAQVQKAKLVWVARARGTLRAMTPVWSLAPERQVRHDFKLRHYAPANGFAAMPGHHVKSRAIWHFRALSTDGAP